MSNYRIKLIAALSAIAFAGAASPVLAQPTSGSTPAQQDPSSSSSSNTVADQTLSTSPSTSSSDSTTSAAGSSSSGSSGSSSTSSGTGSSSSTPTSSYNQDRSTSSSHSSPASMASTTEQVRAASEDDQKRTAGEYKGQKITGANGEDLGKVNDFVVDTQSGKVAFAVVSSGGFLGMGDKLRLVEHNSLQPQVAAEGFTAQMDKVAFEALPVITQQDLDAGKISTDQKKAAPRSSSSSASSSSSGMSQTGHYALASKLSGKNVRAGEREAGSINDIVIDIENGQAHALFEPKREFAGASGKFLVPLSKFEVGSPQAEVIATTLSRSDFGASSQSSTGSSTTEILTPTGRISSGIYPDTSAAPSSSPSGSATGTTGTGNSGISSPDISRSATPGSSSSPDTSSGSTLRSSGASLGSTSPSPGGASSTSAESASSVSFGSASSLTGVPDTSSTSSSPGSSTSRIGSTDTSGTSLSSSSQPPSHKPDRATTRSPSVVGIGTTSSGTAVSTDEQLTPTGRTSAVTESGESISAGSIRSALQQDTTLAQENVQVEAKIILRGTVSSEAMKTRAEDVARRAASNAEIDNQITVGNK